MKMSQYKALVNHVSNLYTATVSVVRITNYMHGGSYKMRNWKKEVANKRPIKVAGKYQDTLFRFQLNSCQLNITIKKHSDSGNKTYCKM